MTDTQTPIFGLVPGVSVIMLVDPGDASDITQMHLRGTWAYDPADEASHQAATDAALAAQVTMPGVVIDIPSLDFTLVRNAPDLTAPVYGDLTLPEAQVYAAYLSAKGEPADSPTGQAYAAVTEAIAAWFAAGH